MARRIARALALLSLLPALATQAFTATDGLESRITAVGLFKNGVAIVRREVTLPGPGTFELTDLPSPVYGTFWIESDAVVETRLTTRQVPEPLGARGVQDLRRDLAGRQVTLHFKDTARESVTGRVVETIADEERASHRGVLPGGPSMPRPQPVASSQFLVLHTRTEVLYIDVSTIAFASLTPGDRTRMRSRPVLALTASDDLEGPATVRLRYLTRGMSWAPSYRVDLTNPKTLQLEQQATIRNELEDLSGARLSLITGFPNVRFSSVRSLLAPGTSLASFFAELRRAGSSSLESGVMLQSTGIYRGPGDPVHVGSDPAPSPDDDVDVHHHDVGPRSLLEGDTLTLSTARAQAAYTRIVDWRVPDTRDAYGRMRHSHRAGDEEAGDRLWDSVRFDNPLEFPMTTAPAMILEGERFRGQSESRWTAPGAELTLRIAPALSIRTSRHERELEGQREIVRRLGGTYRRADVEGELFAHNHRPEPVELIIRRRFSGRLLEADLEPKDVLLEDGVWSINERHELTWNVRLEPGGEVMLKYRYRVLVKD